MSAAVRDAEAARIDLGECAIVCEHAVLRATAVADESHPVILGDHACVGPHPTLLGCEIEAATYVATGATVLHGARVEAGAVVAVGALAHGGTVLPSGLPRARDDRDRQPGGYGPLDPQATAPA
jgi:carbonic anhydrase/acetyltransferase-like protein (isoleucine patch superfamily)